MYYVSKVRLVNKLPTTLSPHRATFHRNDGLASRWNFRLTRSLPLATDLNPIYPEIHRFRLIYTRVFHARLFRTIFLILYEMNFSTKHDLAFLSNHRWMYSGNFSIFSGSFIFSSGIKNGETSISFFFKNHYFIVARRIVVQNCFFQIG